MELRPEEIDAVIVKESRSATNEPSGRYGTVLQMNGIAAIYGLNKYMAGEDVAFSDDVYGMALNLEEDNIAAVILGSDTTIKRR